MMNSKPITTSQIVGLFDERSANEVPGIGSLLHHVDLPQEVLEPLYSHIDTCEFDQLAIISRMLNNTTTRTASFLSGFFAALDLTLEVMNVKSNGRSASRQEAAAFYGAYSSIKKCFMDLGLDELDENKALSAEYADMLCAEILAASVDVFRDRYVVVHDYHTRLEAIRSNLPLIRSLLPEFLRLRNGHSFRASITGAIAVLAYIDHKGRQYGERIIDTYIERWEFDAALFDLILDNEAPALSVGIL